MVISIPVATYEQLKELAWQNRTSMSSYVTMLVTEAGKAA